eukprot:XP_001694841.1 argonaute protein [Chlamydomonas reinhardtii]
MLSKVQLPRRAGRANSATPVSARYSDSANRPGGRGGGQPGRGGGGRGGGSGRGSSSSTAPKELLTPAQYWPSFWTRLFTGLPLGPVEPRQLANGHAARPGYSAAGKTIQVLTNHVPLNVGVRTVHQYDVRISRVANSAPTSSAAAPSGQGGGKPGRGRKEAKVSGQEAQAVLVALLGDTGAGGSGAAGGVWVFDGSQALYGVDLKLVGALDVAECLREAAQMPGPTTRRPPPDEEQPEGSPAPAATSGAAALAVLDLVTRAGVAWDVASVRTGGGSYVSYKQEDASGPVKGLLPMKLLRGFRSAVAQVAAGTTLTIDAASAVVAGDGPLLGQLQAGAEAEKTSAALAAGRDVSALATELGNSKNARRLEEALVGLEVQPSYTANRYKLSGKLGKSARSLAFEFEGRKISVQHPDLPCVLDKKGGALPIELLTVVKYQKRMSRLDARQKADYIRTAALKPADRMRAMREALTRQLGSVRGQVARAFGLAPFNDMPDFLKVPAQLLPGPLLQVAKQQAVEPGNKGEWAGGGVAVAPEWRSGAVLCYLSQSEGQAPLSGLLAALSKALSASSASALPPNIPVIWASLPKPGMSPDKAAADAEFWLNRAAAKAQEQYKRQAQMVMVVLPDRGGVGLYDAIKAAGDGKLGVATQCVNPAKAGLVGPKASSGPSFSYAAQLALSVNAKLGGATTRPAGRPNDWLPLLGGRRLMVGGRGPGRLEARLGLSGALLSRGYRGAAQVSAGVEYAAVVGSADSHAVDYRVQLSAQVAGNRDIVVSMRESVVLMYRDGLSESQFDRALAEEFTAIVQACADVGGPSYRPRICFVVVQKSHNTRFFPTSAESTHKSGNVLPGTAVDRGVTDPHAFDFFLNSHAGIQGTNRAPRYTVLVDEVGFTAEALQLLTHTLCHTYPACTRALSLPPPVRYADRAADRARTLRYMVPRPSGKQGRGVDWYQMLPTLPHAGHVV